MNEYTYPGQAHFADPTVNARCNDCNFYVPRPYVQIKRFCCSKAKQMTGRWQKPIPLGAIACKYFQRRT